MSIVLATIVPQAHLLASSLIGAAQTHYFAAGATGLTSSQLGAPAVGKELTGTGAIGGKINRITGTVADVIGPMSLLGMMWGGMVHTHVFHSPQAKEQGKEILRYSALGIIIAVLAPIAVTAFTNL